MPWYSPINKYLIYQVDFQLNYKLKNKIDKFSRRSNYDSTMHILKINFKRFVQKSQKLPESFADGIGKVMDLNCKIIFLKH